MPLRFTLLTLGVGCAVLIGALTTHSATERVELRHLESSHNTRVEWMRIRKSDSPERLYHDYRTVILPSMEGHSPEHLVRMARAAGVHLILLVDPPRDAQVLGWHNGDVVIAQLPGAASVVPLADSFVERSFAESAPAIDWKHRPFPDELRGAGTSSLPELLHQREADPQAKPFLGVAAGEDWWRCFSTHLLARGVRGGAIETSIAEGHSFFSYDWLVDPAGFTFFAANNLGTYDIGDPVPLLEGTHLEAELPVEAKVKLYRGAELVHEETTSNLKWVVKQEGVYHLEAWLTIDGEERPWILTNGLHVRKPARDFMALPKPVQDDAVRVERNISYSASSVDKTSEQHLDIYLPKGRKDFPVLLFLHGGFWPREDIGRYSAFATRFAKLGIGVVIPTFNERAANPHPAQVNDAAAACAWVHNHIADFGGDPARVYLAGHSLGGHLAALLALDDKFLKAQGLTADVIRGVVCLSGIFDVRGVSKVFGEGFASRDASPIFHVHHAAPPFLVIYCQWDYLGLAAQARAFDRELRRTFVPSELVYIPHENHLQEVVDVYKENDPVVNAVTGFVR